MELKNRKRTFSTILLLFILPGVVPTVLLGVSYGFFQHAIPSLIPFLLIELFISVPLMFILMRKQIKSLFQQQKCVSGWQFTWISVVCLVWAFFIFVIGKGTTLSIKETAFNWLPHWFDLGDYLLHRSQYPSFYPKLIWVILIPSSIIFPVVEEIYFRGYLMQKTNRYGGWSPILNTFLFALYHLWSIWMLPVRFLAMLPLYYFVWKKENIYIGIVVHVLLNLVGDVVLVFPVVFN